jgi:hypothetical protein
MIVVATACGIHSCFSFAAQKSAIIHYLAFHFWREQTFSAKQLLKQSSV